MPSEQFCDIGAIADWKMDMMAWYIFNRLNLITNDVISEAYKIFQQCSVEQPSDNKLLIEERELKINKANQKLENLTEMRMGGEITKEEFQSYKLKVNQEIIKLEQEISELREKSKANITDEKHIISFEEFSKLIKNEVDLSKPLIGRNLLDQIINKIVPKTEP